MANDRLPTPFNVALDEALTLYLQAKRAEGLAPKTLANYEWLLKRLLAWLAEHEITHSNQLTTAHLRAFIADMRGLRQKPATLYTYAKVIKTWTRFLTDERIFGADPSERLAMPRLETRALATFSVQETDQMLKACRHSLRNTALILLLLDTGLRAQELCDLNIADADLKTGTIIVQAGKGRKFRYVFIGDKTAVALRRYVLRRGKLADDAPLFASLRNGKRLTPAGLLVICRHIGTAAKVPHCHPHRFRHTFATWALAAGMDLDSVRRILGHATFAVTQRYLNQLPETLSKTHRAHSPVDNLL